MKRLTLKQATFSFAITFAFLSITRIIRNQLPTKYITGYNFSLLILCTLSFILLIYFKLTKSKK